jgi:alkanesulfonate monooxygenase SsuD/methylene tetrahydromethanopterin reductase-like flavin-dependent oxidoreductase (luciferase family)
LHERSAADGLYPTIFIDALEEAIMRVSTLILPIYRWTMAQQIWQQAEHLGFHAAYTYDHLSWRSFRGKPWFGTVPTLSAAATATERIRIGTMVASPNFRHPVTFAHDLITLDDISGGRLTVGIGAGGLGFDTTVLGQASLTPLERANRFTEFVSLLHQLLTRNETTFDGTFYSAREACVIPGCVQQPRVPFHLAATGPRGMRLAARYGQGWITYGDPGAPSDLSSKAWKALIAEQVARLREACAVEHRNPDDLEKTLSSGSTPDRPTDSVDAFLDFVGRYQELGITEVVLHWPVADSIYATCPAQFERVITEGIAQVNR